MKGVVAAGHPVTAEAGAEILREGGNAVDAAVGAVLTSFATESPLTGFGAGGFMLVHRPGPGLGENVIFDFFVEAPGREGMVRGAELIPVDVHFDASTVQVFNVGAASCGVPGTAAGLAHAAERFGTMPLEALVRDAVRCAREGVRLNLQQAYLLEILAPIYTASPQLRDVYAPGGRVLREGETMRFEDLAIALERFGQEGAEPFYSGEIGSRIATFAQDQGAILSPSDFAAYRVEERKPVTAAYRDCDVLTNPPPSSGGVLIAFALALLSRLGPPSTEGLVAAMGAANDARDDAFSDGLRADGFAEAFLDASALEEAAARAQSGPPSQSRPDGPGDALGSTTHLVAMDADGVCASVTCSNGTGSGVLVPGTGVHLNNMLGEEDLNPQGFHRAPVGTRLPSMMAPTVVLSDGAILAGLGSAGSNRIRSAVAQTVMRLVDEGLSPADAIAAPRVHFEGGALQAEPGADEASLRRIETAGIPVTRWAEKNLFFGGVQAVRRDPGTGDLTGAGDPRRGGAAVLAT